MSEGKNKVQMHPIHLELHNCDLQALEGVGSELAHWQRGINWWIGDCARYAAARFPDTWMQAFPEWMSPGLISRCAKVAAAYPNESDRNQLATWTQHMQVANEPDRLDRVAAMVDKGQTSDESRKAVQAANDARERWLLAIDVNYFLHRYWYSGAMLESADSLSKWIKRTSDRLKEKKGLTDVLCAFDSKANLRKELTEGWEDKYKDRPKKEDELVQQLNLVRELLEGMGFACVSIQGMEADDVMASAAKQFEGRVTLLSADKDLRQCLSSTCNILLDVDWVEDETSGQAMPDYKWLSAGQHTKDTGIAPSQWTEFQAIMGDNVDGITGAKGIGEKGASDLIKQYGMAQAAIDRAKVDEARVQAKVSELMADGKNETPAKAAAEKEIASPIKARARKALIEFEDKLEVTLQLVTLRTDLEVPTATRI